MTAPLLPCPFCGGTRLSFREEDEHHLNSVVTWHELRCDESGCPALMRYPSKQGVVAAWNRRAAPQVVQVKPLEWEPDGDTDFIADTICGQYLVALVHTSYRAMLSYPSDGSIYQTVLAEGLGKEAALEFAQTNFNSRINSALVTADDRTALMARIAELEAQVAKAAKVIEQCAKIADRVANNNRRGTSPEAFAAFTVATEIARYIREIKPPAALAGAQS